MMERWHVVSRRLLDNGPAYAEWLERQGAKASQCHEVRESPSRYWVLVKIEFEL